MQKLLLLLLLTACTAQPARVTDTRWPEAIISTDRQAISEKLVSEYAGSEVLVESVSPSMISLHVPNEDAKTQKIQFGCGSCADPYIRVNFILSEIDGGVKVVSQYWRMIPNYNGLEERHDMIDAGFFNALQKLLLRLRDQLES